MLSSDVNDIGEQNTYWRRIRSEIQKGCQKKRMPEDRSYMWFSWESWSNFVEIMRDALKNVLPDDVLLPQWSSSSPLQRVLLNSQKGRWRLRTGVLRPMFAHGGERRSLRIVDNVSRPLACICKYYNAHSRLFTIERGKFQFNRARGGMLEIMDRRVGESYPESIIQSLAMSENKWHGAQ